MAVGVEEATPVNNFGTAWLAYLDGVFPPTDVLLAKSTDGGITFTSPVVVRQIAGPASSSSRVKGGGPVDYPAIAFGGGVLAISYSNQTTGGIEMRAFQVTGLGTLSGFVPDVAGQLVPGSTGGNFGGIAVSSTGKIVVSYQTPSGGQGPP